jgi:hypothetical protein
LATAFLAAGATFLTGLAGAFLGAGFLTTALEMGFLLLVAGIMLVLTHFKG